jgi:hypothetical protein
MAHAAARQGAWGVSFELADDAREDVMASANMRWLKSLPGFCRIAAIWIGLVCASWSRARRNTSGKPGWPGPLRDESRFLWGLPNLNSTDQERVTQGNKQLLWGVRLFRWAAHRGIPCVIENPAGSRIWLTPQMLKLLARFPSVVVHYCAFGMEWKKPTRLLFCHCQLSDLEKYCCHSCHGLCAHSGKRHQQLTGRSPHGPLWSAVASAYPPKMCTAIAARIVQRLSHPPCPS